MRFKEMRFCICNGVNSKSKTKNLIFKNAPR